MAAIPKNLSDPGEHFCCLKVFNSLTLGNVARIIHDMFIYLLQAFHM